jgi:hypothetical protein
MNSAGRPSRSAATTNSSAVAARGTNDFTPSRVKPVPVRRAVVRSTNGSNSGRGSSTATAAAGTSSPTNAGRYVACWVPSPQRTRAFATPAGARQATARPMSPWARASATSTPVVAERALPIPPSASGMPSIVTPSSALDRFRTVSGAAHSESASAAAGRSSSAANSRVASVISFCSSVGVRSNRPRSAVVVGRAGRSCSAAAANVRLATPNDRNPTRLAVNTACSIGPRSRSLSITGARARRFRAASPKPIASRPLRFRPGMALLKSLVHLVPDKSTCQ